MMSASTDESQHVLMEDRSSARILTLNRPKQLNAVSFVMGKGRAFSVGGDLAKAGGHMNPGNWKSSIRNFKAGFIMMYVIATHSKPQVSILNGIVMGGGACAAVHGRFRVATENSLFAVSETALGFFPDMGASYFLSRLPGFFGEYVSLTGARLDGAEMLASGLATHFVPSQRLAKIEEALVKAAGHASVNAAVISSVIGEFSEMPSLKNNSAYHRLNIINKCFSRTTVEEIIAALQEREAADQKDCWISSTIQSLKKASPTSLKVTLRSIREGRLQNIDKCMIREYRMVCHMTKGEISKDLAEGCRALLLEKDKNPKWEPAKLESISDKMVDRFFSRVDEDDWEDLKLPLCSNLPAYPIAKL